MRYNSLRSQLNWHSRQQTHLFKKIAKTPNEKQVGVVQEDGPNGEEAMKGHELMWLQKMMRELQQYQEEAADTKQKHPKEPESVQEIIKEKCNVYRPPKIAIQRHHKVVASLDQSAKSAKKIKFQVVTHADKPQSAKKTITSEQKSKPKSNKKTPSKNQPKKNLPEKNTTAKQVCSASKEIQICCPSNTKVIEVEDIKTDPYSFKETDLRILQNLWRKESEEQEKQKETKIVLSTKKSVGKIIRNSEKLNKTCVQGGENKSIPSKESAPFISSQNSSYKQYKEARSKQSVSINSFQSKEMLPLESKEIKTNDPLIPAESPKDAKQHQRPSKEPLPQKSKAKYEKIYIKLQTQKLSEYLCQKSQVKMTDESADKIIDTNQYQKYCPTQRADQITASASISIGQDKRCFTNQKTNRQIQSLPKREEPAPRTKSEQRKFNKCAQAIRPTNQFELEQKTASIKLQEASSIIISPGQRQQEQVEYRPEIKLKRRYEYREQQMPTKTQKLFTLHSVSSDHSEPKEQLHIQQQIFEEEPSSINVELEELPSITLSQPQTNQSSAILSQQPSSEIVSQMVEQSIQESLFINEEPSKDPTQELTLLFNFLDEGHRGLLTDTNCFYDSLTEQLKLLFSAILNQIRTKKRFYNLQKFIEECKEVLQIKNEVYMNNHSKQNKTMVYHSLRQNILILKKKYPLMFVRHTLTQSTSETSNAQSKKSSFNYGHSVVIDKVEIDRQPPRKDIEEGLFKNCLQEKGINPANISQPIEKRQALSFEIKYDKSRKDKQNSDQLQPTRKFSKRRQDNDSAQIDLLQPEIYLQKKYGFSKGQEQACQNNDKMSSIMQKTRGYLQNLDSYLKMR